jgi:ABC-type transporter Mla subunit MlaD
VWPAVATAGRFAYSRCVRLSTVRNELFVGWFILAALLVCGVALILRPRTQNLMASRHELHFTVDNGQGLRPGAFVLVQGIRVGEIDNVELTPDNKVSVTCYISAAYAQNIRTDARVTVVQPPLGLGQTRVEIDPGKAPSSATQGARLPVTNEPTFLDKLNQVEGRVDTVIARVDSFVNAAVGTLDKFRDMVDRIDKSKGLAGQFIHDEGMSNDLRQTMSSMRRVAERIEKEAVDETVRTLKRGQELMDSLRDEEGKFQTLLASLNKATTELQTALSKAKVGDTTATLRATADTLAKAVSKLSEETSPLTRDTRRTLAALHETSRAMKKLSDELARQPQSVIWGRKPESSPGLRR